MKTVCIHIVYIISRIRSRMMRFALIISFLFQPLDLIAEEIDFNRDVRPILSQNCFVCHGPDKAHRKADLRLDTEQGSRDAVSYTHLTLPTIYSV